MPLTPVRPASDKFDNSKPVEGLNVVENIVSIQPLCVYQLTFRPTFPT